MQTAETEHTFILHPDRLFVFHRYGRNRTVSRTLAAADATVFHEKMLGLALNPIIKRLCYEVGHECRHAGPHPPVSVPLSHLL